MPPHIKPDHCVLAPACDPLLKSAGGVCAVTVSDARPVVPFADAAIAAVNASWLYGRYLGFVATVNVALVAPAGTVTVGCDAASSMSELVSATTVPPVGAAAPSVTVHVAEAPLPPAITVGLHATPLTVCACAADTGHRHATSTSSNRGGHGGAELLRRCAAA